MKSNRIFRNILILMILALIFSTIGCNTPPAEVTIATPDISPKVVTEGELVSIDIKVSSSGEKGSAEYQLNLQVNGTDIETREGIINAGSSKMERFQYKPESAGIYNVDINGKTVIFEVFSPARFKFGELNISPVSPKIDQEIIASVNVTNEGGVQGTYTAVLMVGDEIVSSQNIQILPGETVTVDASYTRETSGTCLFEFCGLKKELTIAAVPTTTPVTPVVPVVPKMFTYTNENFFYKISYPPKYSVNDSNTFTIVIGDMTGGITILTDRLSVDMTPKQHFDLISEFKKLQLPTWESSNVVEIIKDGKVIGYSYDYSNKVSGTNWIGKGMTLKKGGFGFYVVFTTPENAWEENKETAIKCLESFQLPVMGTSQFSSSTLGVTLTIPSEWTLIETGESKEYSFIMYPPHNWERSVLGFFYTEAVSQGTTAEQWIADLAVRLRSTDGGVQVPFHFDNSVIGHEFSDLLAEGDPDNIVGKIRYIAQVKDTKVFYFLFMGEVEFLDLKESILTQFASSLVIGSE